MVRPANARHLAPERARRPRVLLVDDDERNLLALSEVLGPIADVVTATSGRMALRELLRDEFAVILLDVFMPDMDGYETASLIRKRSQTARIPIIFLSAVNKETEHLMRGYAMGAVDYVFKPVDPVVLKSKVAVFVDLFELRQQVAEQARAEQELREAKLRAETERLAVERELQHARLRQAAILLEALPLALYEARFDDRGRLTRQLRRRRRGQGRRRGRRGAGVRASCVGATGSTEAQLAELERRLASGERNHGHRTIPLDRAATAPRSTCIDQCVGSAETPGPLGRHPDRHHRAARAGAAADPVAQSRSARPVDRRRRARFQQPARRGARAACACSKRALRSAKRSSGSSTTCAWPAKRAPSWSAD